MSEPLLWERMTVADIREAMQTTRTVLIPIGCVEQHGYHLTTRTDSFNAEGLCVGASAQTGAIVAPTYYYTYSGGELPGTINISPAVVSQVIAEILRDLSRQGWQNLILVLGHGGSENDAAVEGAADIFLRTHPERADLNVAVFRFWEKAPSAAKAFADHDYHAGYFETSIIMHLAPDHVRDEMTLDKPDLVEQMRDNQDAYQTRTKNVEHESILPHIHQNPETEVGVIGDPATANAALGKQIIEEGIEALVELIRAVDA